MLIEGHCNRLVLAGYRPRSVEARRCVLRAFQATLGDRQLSAATRLDVEAYLARPLSPESRRAYLGHLRAFYAWAVEEQHVSADPTTRLPAIRVPKGVPRPISADDLVRAINQAPTRMRAWLLLMSLAGLRCLEVSRLQPQDLLETDAGVLLFLREVKGGGTGTVPAHSEVLAALNDVPIRNGLWWSCSARHVSLTTSQYLASVGVRATAHQLRHYAATSWLRHSGHDLLTTSKLMRHAVVSTTQIYAQLDDSRPVAVVQSVPHLRAV